ncbi:benzoate diol dehydrogenase BenD [Sphingobium yanoikuyae]|jgi:dihydroxycyclohexadiene carboxylate dehydrogenase|uniref:1,6-dihydroxycyclohexa-2,4-diene-1-carboxylate dehydrogenase n=1 Tax=Sphingobium yanoikuyae TaxID=13690 RepID=A0A085K0R9_SPHYA|nr:benzoate diol dehydrogenase BenD [Sphingobium yanoikuyae]AYO76848.1 1,6-dihydroxycyclohexa-2,4-diene-1-carboxylate dehydrogenase [Sphingobium yanoikuyae]KFD26315.1 1,6-dihydroxycyclohexa-2,4-diene-1-carboxylate dehydrogenase [Sphingobium yanoikuyae]KZC79221.1 1,6-dihydroxycyclohexa-2,4-diene-1-carboxylate dehydrogenase [Sphingobium yanoikuyae]MDV3479499.1 benzoate diol dehydrogenase BenD [Sphingobium yanoikuyae]
MIFQGRLAGKVMVVTGAAQGIGAGVATRAAAEGASLVLVDRADFVADVEQAIVAAGGKAISVTCDLETYEGAAQAMAAAIAAFGRIDILINNVGGAIRMRPYAQFEPAQIDAEIRRSLMPTLYCCHAVLPVMLEQGAGTIVNLSSNATRGIRRVPYSAAKGGINGLTQALAMEYAEAGIRVVATAPGGTSAPPRRVPRNAEGDNAQEQAWMAEAVEQVTSSAFMKRYGTLDEQIAPILFLASDEASYVTGSVLPVAGGDIG